MPGYLSVGLKRADKSLRMEEGIHLPYILFQLPFFMKFSGTTYIFDLSDYTSEQYVVSLVLEGSVLASEKFIVEK